MKTSSWTRREQTVPQRFPSCVVFGRGRSRQYGEGSCVAGTETQICHSGIGRSCYRHGCRACPVHRIVSILFSDFLACPLNPKTLSVIAPSLIHCLQHPRTRKPSYLSRVNSRSGEGVVVGTHVDCCVDIRRLCWLSIGVLPRSSLWVEVGGR